ncbi:MAG TPA: dihydrolipoamide acetyltransferase family protein, partial [Thermosynergistes sp.]|nr:dihydrolipoamide acetyltransferase family protein [Thermosynergistes sp.]
TEVPVNQPIAVIGVEGEDISSLLREISGEVPQAAKSATVEALSAEKEEPVDVSAPAPGEGKPRATPAARRLAREYGVDLAAIKGSGPRGRVHKADVEEHLKRAVLKPVEAPAAAAKPTPQAPGRVIPLSGIRGVIAKKMRESVNTAPHYFVFMEIDMSEALKVRERINVKLPEEEKLSINTLLAKAAAVAISEFPIFNSYVDGSNIVLKEEINIGIAVAIEDGIIVPVIRNVDRKGLRDVAREERELIARARAKALKPEDYEGGSFTISNLGMFGVPRFTAIINQPEVAILAVGKVADKVVIENEEMVVRPIMEVSLSSDHRVIDGATAARFLNRLKEIMEDPMQM